MSDTPKNHFDLAVLGAGPGGLSAAARAAQRGMSHVLLEAADKFASYADGAEKTLEAKHVVLASGSVPVRLKTIDWIATSSSMP